MLKDPAIPDLKTQKDNLPEVLAQETADTRNKRLQAKLLLDQAEISLDSGEVTDAFSAIEKSVLCCEGHYPERTLQMVIEALKVRLSQEPSDVTARCILQLENAEPDTVYGPSSECWPTTLNQKWLMEDEIRKNTGIILSQKKRIKTLEEQIRILEKQIEQLKAVDMSVDTTEQVGEVP